MDYNLTEVQRANQAHVGAPLPVELGLALRRWRTGTGPLYERLSDAIAAAIVRGDLLAGAQLPPERTLARQIGVGRATVGSAYRRLEARRLLDRGQGRGTFVSGGEHALPSRAGELATQLQRNVVFRRVEADSEAVINLLSASGSPAASVCAAVEAAVAALDWDSVLAGHGHWPLGFPPLRAAVAAHLTAQGHATDPGEVLITAGAQQAISLVAAWLVRPGAAFVIEDPTFTGAIDAFAAAGAKLVPVRVGDAGVDIASLRSTLARTRADAVFATPSFQNPTGATMPDTARGELARLSERTGTLVVEDSVLAELWFETRPPPPIASYAPRAPIVTIGSLSKLFWGGLRVGWLRAPRRLIAQLGQVKAISDLGSSVIAQAVAAALLTGSENIGGARRAQLRARAAILEAELERELPSWDWRPPAGGLSVWARVASGAASDFVQTAAAAGVLVTPEAVTSASGHSDAHVRVPFDRDEAVLREAVGRLARAWARHVEP